jgi:putative ATP-grasp target RiPP
MQQSLNHGYCDDPLAPASSRFAQGRSRFDPNVNHDTRSSAGMRPFGLRFAITSRSTDNPLPAWRFDEQRQIGVDQNGEPWYRGIVDMTMKTSGPSPDGGGSTGGEEWGPDYLTDEPMT